MSVKNLSLNGKLAITFVALILIFISVSAFVYSKAEVSALFWRRMSTLRQAK